MQTTDADRQLVQDLVESFSLKLDPWQQRLLALILASHRERGTDNSICTSAIVTAFDHSILVCTERGPHRVHRNGDTTWTRTCGARSVHTGMACGLEPHAEGTVHCSGAYIWT